MEFVGEIENLSDIQRKAVEKALEKLDHGGGPVTVETVGKKGDNYVASVLRIKADTKDGRPIRMVAKVAPTNEVLRLMIQAAKLFSNETIMYEEVLPKFDELQNAADVPPHDRIPRAKCYGTVSDELNELILLEDLKERDLEMRDRMVSLTNDEVRMALKQLAQIHALSFALQEKEPELHKKYANLLFDTWSQPQNEDMKKSFVALEQMLLGFLKSDEDKKRAQGAVSNIGEVAENLKKSNENGKYSVILQGDCWANNIMFRLQEGKSVECMMIDYQLSRLSSPVVDILYLIFNCTDLATRKDHYHDWLDHYYKVLDDSLFHYNLKSSFVYPRDKMDADLKRYGKFCLGLSLVLASVIFRESDEAFDLSDIQDQAALEADPGGMGMMKQGTLVRVARRVQDLVDSFIAYGYL
ncbi:uncharacterized protein LOC105384146 [Plutella xylostella]|uniref:uncharacterized protein LOC105384146 n=1 Tax=Plutella xylostella TaxID=51655 RepID=UPI0020324A32|nr:uncharacterized protein LOC105384146 [Plutella xylostella]